MDGCSPAHLAIYPKSLQEFFWNKEPSPCSGSSKSSIYHFLFFFTEPLFVPSNLRRLKFENLKWDLDWTFQPFLVTSVHLEWKFLSDSLWFDCVKNRQCLRGFMEDMRFVNRCNVLVCLIMPNDLLMSLWASRTANRRRCEHLETQRISQCKPFVENAN